MARDDLSPAARSVVRSVLSPEPSAPQRAPSPPSRAELERAVLAFVREAVRPGRWRVRVPGKHSRGGIEYDALLDILASQGRDILANTVQLAQAVRAALLRSLSGARRMPTIEALRKAAEPALLEHVERRMERGNGDVLMTPLSPGYARRKRAEGRGSQPITVATGETRRALSRNAYVEWT